MERNRTRTTLPAWARLTGTGVLAALALLDLAWIARDFLKAPEVQDVWWMWSGLLFRAQDGVWATSYVEPTLLVLYAVCGAVVAARSSAAPATLASAGGLTVLLRVPSLWNLNAPWIQGGVSDGLHAKALAGTITALVLGAALVVLAACCRRPAPAAETEPPARPSPGGAATAAVLLGTAAATLAAWELHAWRDQGGALYAEHLTGHRVLVTLLAVPDSWYAWCLVLLCLAASVAALARTPYARPLGMTTAAPMLGLGLFSLSFAVRAGLVRGFGDLGARDQLWLLTAAFQTAAALAVLVALSPHGTDRVTGLAPARDAPA